MKYKLLFLLMILPFTAEAKQITAQQAHDLLQQCETDVYTCKDGMQIAAPDLYQQWQEKPDRKLFTTYKERLRDIIYKEDPSLLTDDRNQSLYGSVMNDDIKEWDDEFYLLEQEIQKIDPNIIEEAKDLDEIERLAKYKGVMAEYAFSKIKNSYISAINKFASKNGRTVKITEYDEIRDKDYRMLDGSQTWHVTIYETYGTKERTKCVKDPHNGPNLCFFPDGYEHYEVIYAKRLGDSTEGNRETLVVNYDDYAQNTSYRISVSRSIFLLSAAYEPFLTTKVTPKNYRDIQQDRNQIIQDLTEGMSIHECNGMLHCIIDGERTKYYTMHDNIENAEWKSGFIPEYIGREYVNNHK